MGKDKRAYAERLARRGTVIQSEGMEWDEGFSPTYAAIVGASEEPRSALFPCDIEASPCKV